MSTHDHRDGDDFLDPQPRIEDQATTSHVRRGDADSPEAGSADERDGDPTQAGRAATDGHAGGSKADADAEADADGSKERKRGGFKQWLKELPVMLAIAFVIAVLLKSFVVQAFWIPSGSMEKTLHGCPGCVGDRILVNRMSYWFDDPQPGDVVVFEAPTTWEPESTVEEPDNAFGQAWLWTKRLVGAAPPAARDLVKRVIATGGQTVSCCDAQGRVLVDGKPLNEPYIYLDGQDPSAQYALRNFGPITVPKDRLFVMGDHRNFSADSRAHIDDQYQGTIPIDSVVGRAFVTIYPFDRFGWLSSQNPQAQALAVGAVGIVLDPPVLAMAFVLPLSVIRVGRQRRDQISCTR